MAYRGRQTWRQSGSSRGRRRTGSRRWTRLGHQQWDELRTLFDAAEKGDLGTLAKLTSSQSSTVHPKTRWTLLHAAAFNNQADAARVLLRTIHPNETNNWKQTAAHLAAMKGNTEVLDVLLSDTRLNRDMRDNWDCKYNDWLATPLYRAVKAAQQVRILNLLRLNADPDCLPRKLSYCCFPTKDYLPKSARQLAQELKNDTLRLFRKSGSKGDRIDRTEGGAADDWSSLDASSESDDRGDSDDSDSSYSPGTSKGPLRLAVVPARKMKTAPHIYKMDTQPRGLVCIINYKNFRDRPEWERIGSEYDVTNLKNLFTQMGYEVQSKSDLTEDETKSYLRDIRSSQELESVSCLVMFIMSHGIGKETYITHDGKFMTTEWIRERFYDTECPNLKDKPKLFFFHFCRGDFEEMRPQTEGPVTTEIRTESCQTESGLVKCPARDIWCAYSTTDGFYANRREQSGSPFLVAVCRTLARHAWNKDLAQLETCLKKNCNKDPYATVFDIQKFYFSEFYFNPMQINV